MKIAFIGQKGIPVKLGGVEKYTEELSTRLAERGHEVFVYVRNNYTDKKLKNYKGVHLIHLPSISTKHLDAISHTFLATVHAIFQNYDVIQYHSIGPTSMSLLVKIFKPKTALLSIYQCQDYLHQKWGRLARTCLRFGELITCKVPDKTIAVTKILAKYAQNKFQADVEIIPNGTNATFNSNSEFLAAWNLEKKKYILAVSRFIKHKGLHYLIEAFKNLENRGKTKGMKLVLVGNGFYTDDYVKYLRKISRQRKNIIFTGAQSGDALSQLFSHAYLFVQPSESEGLSIALLEAMRYGQAILASDIPENLEALKGSGKTFAAKNYRDLEFKLENMIDNPNKTQLLGEKAKKIAETHYDWEVITEKIIALYQNVLNSKFKKYEKYA